MPRVAGAPGPRPRAHLVLIAGRDVCSFVCGWRSDDGTGAADVLRRLVCMAVLGIVTVGDDAPVRRADQRWASQSVRHRQSAWVGRELARRCSVASTDEE